MPDLAKNSCIQPSKLAWKEEKKKEEEEEGKGRGGGGEPDDVVAVDASQIMTNFYTLRFEIELHRHIAEAKLARHELPYEV